MGKYVIFSIDGADNIRHEARFLRFLDEHRAMSKLTGEPALCIGCYEGMLERSYIVSELDWRDYIYDSGYVSHQECFLWIEDGHRGVVYASLEWNTGGNTGETRMLGQFVAASKEEAMWSDGWTYRPDQNQYYIIKPFRDASFDEPWIGQGV